jgi:hypothetical protein
MNCVIAYKLSRYLKIQKYLPNCQLLTFAERILEFHVISMGKIVTGKNAKRHFVFSLWASIDKCPSEWMFVYVPLRNVGCWILDWFIENRQTVSPLGMYQIVGCGKDVRHVTQISDTDNIWGCENSPACNSPHVILERYNSHFYGNYMEHTNTLCMKN